MGRFYSVEEAPTRLANGELSISQHMLHPNVELFSPFDFLHMEAN